MGGMHDSAAFDFPSVGKDADSFLAGPSTTLIRRGRLALRIISHYDTRTREQPTLAEIRTVFLRFRRYTRQIHINQY
jgi:hypothetical protein